jgi:TonB-linked SusC/RagA family outer membrane protein
MILFSYGKPSPKPGLLSQMLKVMKLTSIFLIIFLIEANAKVYTQVTLSFKNAPVEKVFKEIGRQTGYDFLYTKKMLEGIPSVDISVQNASVNEVLNKCFKNQPLDYSLDNNVIVITRKESFIKPEMVSEVPEKFAMVQGTVFNAAGEALVGVSVTVKGLDRGTSTDEKGKFSIDAPLNSVLVFTYIGFETKELKIANQKNVSITLTESNRSLDEVVVTAFGIQRQKNALPYAAQQISGDDLNKTRINNISSGLSGKVSGLQIIQGNSIGGSVNVVIRGIKSLTGNNQALFVVDGVPVDNSNTNSRSQQTGAGGYDYGNAAADINPDDIQSVNVLKGAAASALYGSRAANGVIMITTKKAKKGLGISVNSGTTVGTIDKSTFVKYQQEYGAGRSDPYGKDGFLYFDVNGDNVKDLVVPTFAPRSWGPHFDPNLMVYNWESFDPASPNYKKPKPWVAPKNGPETFYETAISTNNSVMIDGIIENKASFKLGYVRNIDNGTLPNSRVQKDIINFGATYNITDKLVVSALANYSQVAAHGRYGTGYDSRRNINSNFRHFNQVNVDIQEQKVAYFRNRKNVTWNWADPSLPDGLKPAFNNNIYWSIYENTENDSRNRVFGNVNLSYQITDWLDIMGRVSVDNYNEFQEEHAAVGTVGVPFYSRFDRSYNELNYDLLATAKRKITEDLELNALAGINIRKNKIASNFAATSGGLIVPGLYSISNSLGTVPAPVETSQPKAVDGYFGGVTLSYREFLTLDATLRRDRSSTLPDNANAYNYYAVSGSWLFSQHMKNIQWISTGKLRANYATVGNDAPWGSVKDVTDKPNPFGSYLLFSMPDTKNNSALKPEQTKSKEIGVEMAFLNNRLGFDASYYHTNTIDQIIPVAVSTATGYASKFINAGDIENKGIELLVYATPVKTNNFSWNTTINFTRNRNKVLSLYNDSKNLVLGSFQGGVTLNASLGKPYGELQSTTYKMVDGQPLVKANGLYDLTTTTSNVIGNVNPDWTGGISNTFRYKDFSLSFLIDVRQGGDLFSLDMYYGQASGILPESAGLNDLGNPKRDAVANGGGIILPGVTQDGKPNTKRVTITSNNSFVYPQSHFSYDASYVKLREASFSYSLPKKVLSKIDFVKNIQFSLYGRNLWLIHKNIPYADPEENLSSGNIQGYQSGSYPTTRSIGLNIQVKF